MISSKTSPKNCIEIQQKKKKAIFFHLRTWSNSKAKQKRKIWSDETNRITNPGFRVIIIKTQNISVKEVKLSVSSKFKTEIQPKAAQIETLIVD